MSEYHVGDRVHISSVACWDLLRDHRGKAGVVHHVQEPFEGRQALVIRFDKPLFGLSLFTCTEDDLVPEPMYRDKTAWDHLMQDDDA